MWRQQTALVFLGLLAGSILIVAVRSNAADLSLIGYDNRDVVQPEDAAQGRPCQPCLPGQSCPPAAAAQSDKACQSGSTAGGPMILNIGPPPQLYSPSADFGARIAAAPGGLTVVGDDSLPTDHIQHSSSTSEPVPMYWTPQPIYSASAVAPDSRFSMPVYGTAPPSIAFAPTYPAPFSALPPAMCNPAIVYQSIVPAPLIQPASYPPTSGYEPGKIYSSSAANEADRLDHILQAIDHLEAAGMATEADQLRRQCDAQMRQVVSELKTAEAEITRLRQALAETKNKAAAVNHPRQPVVTAALPAERKVEGYSYPVQQAAYFAPADSTTGPATTLDEPGLPAPFVPQPVEVEPTKAFAKPGDGWGVKPALEPFTEAPVMLDSWIFTPDKH
jgi:hypothetical protein